MEGQLLCTRQQLAETGAVGVDRDDPPFRIVIVLDGEAVRGYVNSCPHRSTPLEMFPNKFLDETGRLLVCTTHGARFRVEDGVCVEGPCRGGRLMPVRLTERAGEIYFAGD